MSGQENMQAVQPKSHTIYDQDEINNINDYMTANIFVCLCCCWPIGIADIMKSNECQEAKRAGNVEAALRYSASAKNLFIITIVGTIAAIIVTAARVILDYGLQTKRRRY